jgi:hypothetical protein
MAWRLGTWRTESLFERLDALLRLSSRIPNWSNEESLLVSPDFGDFWSLVWQLQMAEYLCVQSSHVRWNKGGPDLVARVGDRDLFVECYVYRKSFGLEECLGELLRCLGSDIRLLHDPFMPFTLPLDPDGAARFLSESLSTVADETKLTRLREAARQTYPQIVARPASSLVIFVEGEDPDRYDPRILQKVEGDPARYLEVVFRESVGNKAAKNRLVHHRPNLVAVNYLLSGEGQVALNRAQALGQPLPRPRLEDSIDALAIAALGIDEALTMDRLHLLSVRSPDHPAHTIAQVVSAAGP